MPDLKSSQINAWIHFLLTQFGLRELNLCIWVREPGDSQLPQQIFTYETLDVLKLDTNLGLDQIIFAIPSYCLPNLKLFHLCASLVSDNNFVTMLVSNCPLLEDLSVEAWRDHVHDTIIYSHSLRKLRIKFQVLGNGEFDNCDSVLIHTPNLEYFEYLDDLAYHYSIPEMHSLVEARITINYDFDQGDIEVSYHQLLGFIRPFCNVHHLTLLGCFTEDLDRAEVKDQLPLFPNLSHLELGCASEKYYWDKLLLAFLNRSPVLETLVFLEGLTMYYGAFIRGGYKQLESELEVLRAFHAIPSCCIYQLKRIEIHTYYGLQREIEIIKFFLRHALVLEELVIYRVVHGPFDPATHQFEPVADLMSMQSTLHNLPRASVTCSISVLSSA